MPRIPFLRLGRTSEDTQPPLLTGSTLSISLEGLQVGVDNLRHDVHLSRGFVEQGRLQVARLIVRHGGVEGLLAAEAPVREKPRSNYFIGNPAVKETARQEPMELKPLLAELHVGALNRAKTTGNLAVDLLARVAIIKFLRIELNAQFAETLERCRMMLRNYEGVQGIALEHRERVAAFQVGKKIILRKAGQELFHTLREIERETLARMRRSLFGTRSEAESAVYESAHLQ